jgi:uncharacterized protein YoaH (UPF0181 family)
VSPGLGLPCRIAVVAECSALAQEADDALEQRVLSPSMDHLSDPAREKAIAVAKALLAEGMDEGKAIRIAIVKAKQWAADHGLLVRAHKA